MKKLKSLALITLCFLITSCSIGNSKQADKDVFTQANTTISNESGKNASELNVESIIKEICSDEYLGRVSGTEENVKAGQFIKNYYEAIGLEPFNSSSYYQEFEVDLPFVIGKSKADNVVGYIKGKDSSKAVVISAHFDHVTYEGKPLPGVIDNASGVATLLETAKDLVQKSREKQFDYDIVIAAFNAEELGLYGSNAFVKTYKDKYTDMYNINIDCIGFKDGNGLAVKNSETNSTEIYNDFINIMKESDVNVDDIPYAYSNGKVIGTSDHLIFQSNGFAAVVVGQDGIGDVIHTPDDNLNCVDYKSITDIKNAIVKFVVDTNGTIY